MTNETTNTEPAQESAGSDSKRLVMRAEVRSVRDITDEYESYLVVVVGDKSMPYMHIPDTMPDDVLDAVLAKLNA